MLLPVHARMAELWTFGRKRELTEDEQMEMEHCLRINADYAYRMAELENLSLMAYMTEDWEWQHEICAEIDQLKAGVMKPKKRKSAPKKKKSSEADQEK